jgi:hypothetical protein
MTNNGTTMRELDTGEIDAVSGGRMNECLSSIGRGALGGFAVGGVTGGAIGTAFFGIGAPVGAFAGGLIGSLVGGAIAIEVTDTCQF